MTYESAMQARIEHDDFIDSSSPYEGEVCTADPWPLPAGEPLSNKFAQPRESVADRIRGYWEAVLGKWA